MPSFTDMDGGVAHDALTQVIEEDDIRHLEAQPVVLKKSVHYERKRSPSIKDVDALHKEIPMPATKKVAVRVRKPATKVAYKPLTKAEHKALLKRIAVLEKALNKIVSTATVAVKPVKKAKKS